MFESIVSSVLNQVLGNYVDNLDGSQLKLGIFSGNVVLKNLKLKKEAVDKLNLPIEVFEGHLGSLELKIPWANLKNRPVKVFISDLYILAGPPSEAEYDPELEEKRVQQVKQELLETAELFRSSSSSKAGAAENETFVNALVTKIIDNLQVVIKNIHVRFEDGKSNVKSPFAVGLTLSNLSAVSTDSNWVEAFIEDSKAPTHKLLKLDSLAMYWIPNSESLMNLPPNEFVSRFKAHIHSESNNVDLRYLLKPVSAIGKAILRKQICAGEAKNHINLEFDSFRIKMDDEQYYDILLLAQNAVFATRNAQYKKYRPALSIKPVNEPLIWFKYAVTCVLEKIKARNKTRLWINVIKRRQLRKKYVELFKKKEVDGILSAEDAAHFKTLEEMLSFEDIKFYRSLARSEMKTEKLIPFALKQQQQQQQASGSFGFISKWWSGTTSTIGEDALIKDEDIKKFYETIEFDENASLEEQDSVPKDSKLFEISFDLKTGSISLAQTNSKELNRKTILSLQFIDLIAHVIKRPDTLRAEVSLLDFSIIEKLTEYSIFPNMVRAKPESIAIESFSVSRVVDEVEELARMASTAKEPFLSFVMDELAENNDADKSISFHMKPLEIVFNHQASKKIVDFVYGDRAKSILDTLANAAESQINELANKTRASLENALEEHKAIDLSVDIDAPIIYIPYDCEDPQGFLFIADLGHIEVRSRLVTEAQKKEFSRKKRRKLTGDEMSALYALMYDVLSVHLSRIKLSYANSLSEWNRLNEDPEFLPETNRIIDDIDVSLSIATCIVPKAANLAQKKIHARLPVVQLIFSDEKYKKVMKLMEAISPEKPVAEPETIDATLMNESRSKSIFGDESTTRHSLSLSPKSSSDSVTLMETDDEFYDIVDSENSNNNLSASSDDSIPEYEAIKIDLLIEIEEICAKLIRENKKYLKKDLLTLVAKKLQIACNVKPFNTIVNLLLESFFIRDDMNFESGTDAFLMKGLGQGASESLLKINLNLVENLHPLFSDLYNSANIQCLLELAALNFYLNPSTLIQTAEFFDTMFENEKDLEVSEFDEPSLKRSRSLGVSKRENTLSRTASRRSAPKMSNSTWTEAESSNSKKKEEPGKKILLTAKLSQLAVICGLSEDHFADLVLSSALAAVCVETNGDINFNGKLADLVIKHVKQQRDFDFLRIDGVNALELSYKKMKSDQLVKLSTGALHFTYDALFIEDSCIFTAKLANEAKILEEKRLEKEKKLKRARKARLRLAKTFEKERIDLEFEAIAEETLNGDQTADEDVVPTDEMRLQYEIDISSPVLDFPHPEGFEQMILSIFLGHIHASNSFKAASDSSGNPLKALGTQLIDQFINARLDSMRIELQSSEGGVCKLLDDVSIGVDVSLIAKATDRDYAETDVDGSVDVVRLKMAQKQLKQVLNLVDSLQKSLDKALIPLKNIKPSKEPEVSSMPVKAADKFVLDEQNSIPTAVEVCFGVKSIELVLFEEWEVEPLARFALEDLNTNFILQKDTSIILEQYVTSICASDLRSKVQRQFKEIIISDISDRDDVKFKYERTNEGDSIVKVEVNAPKIVLSMDFINSISAVFEGLEKPKEGVKPSTPRSKLIEETSPESLTNESVVTLSSSEAGFTDSEADLIETVPAEPPKTFILAEIGSLELYILEDPDSASSEAMRLSIEKVTFAQQTNMSLSIDGISCGFVNMNDLKGVIQFIDPFDITATVELSSTANEKVTQVWAIVKPVTIRFSYQDIQFFTKLSEQFSKKPAIEVENEVEIEAIDGMSESSSPALSTSSGGTVLSTSSRAASTNNSNSLMKIIEQVQVNLEGIRLAFIDDFSNVHIPMIDISVDRIAADVKDWTSGLKLNGILKMHANFYNRTNSHWEPIIEPWSLDLNVITEEKLTEVLVSSEKTLEVIASHAFLDSLLSVTGKIAVAKPRAASSYRVVSKPYLIRNYTGHGISLWSDYRSGDGDDQAEIVEIEAGRELPYEFEDWRTLRSSTKAKSHKISIHLMDSPWESVKNISLDQEGMFVFPLRPKINSVSHKLVCQVQVISGVRHIIIRSATCFKNNTSFDLEIIDIAAEKFTDSIIVPKNGGIGSLPVNFSAGGAFKVRPAGQNYSWSSQKYDIYELLNVSKKTNAFRMNYSSSSTVSMSIKCDPEDPETATPFFLDLQAESDTPEEVIYASAALASQASEIKKETKKFYGLGTIVFTPSIEIENLLPFDFGYKIYDLDGKYDFSGTLAAGATCPLHGADVKHSIGLALEIESRSLKTKHTAQINNGAKPKSSGDRSIQMIDEDGIETKIYIEYDIPVNFGSKKIKIYSPYVILNQTEIPLEFKSSNVPDQKSSGQYSETDKPLLFSYPESNFVSGKDRIRVKAGGSEWSKPISLDAVGNVTYFDLFDKSSDKWYNFALYVHLGSDRFSRVHIVKVTPRFVVANRVGKKSSMHIQAGDEEVCVVEDGALMNFHCNPAAYKSVRISADGRTWTPRFAIGDVGETYFKVFDGRRTDSGSEEKDLEAFDLIRDAPMHLIKVSNVLETQVLYLTLTKERNWPFRIVNRSSVDIKYCQKGCSSDFERILLPGESENFSWDDPSASQLLLSVTVMERQRDYNIRELGQCKPLIYRSPGGEKAYLSVAVEAKGPIIVVKFKNFDVKASRGIFRLNDQSSRDDKASFTDSNANNEDADADDDEFKVKEAKDEVGLSFTLKLAGFGVSLIGPDLIEFMYVYGKGLEFRLQQSKLFQTLGFKLKWFQIDNCLYDYTHPILFYPAVVQKRESELDQHPTLNVGIIKSVKDSHGVDYYKYFGVLLQEMNIELGEELLKKVLLFAQFEAIKPESLAPLLNEADFRMPPLRRTSVDGRLMYFELFQIHPIKLNVTFSMTEMSGDDGSSGGISAYNPLGPVMSVLSMASGNISDAPLKFNSLLLEHPIVSGDTLKDRVLGHYTQQAIVQVHKILGSIDMLGNPVGLFNTMGEGMTDLFYEPYQGFVSDRPQDIGIGLAKGGFSFVRKTVSGLTGTFSKFTGSLGKGLAAATLDTSFQRNRRTTQARNRPTNAALGVSAGAKSLYRGVASGLTGIVEKPMEGARAAGVGGFFKGVGVGLLGAVTKPLVGAIDLTTSISEGVKNTADGDAEDEVSQIRWPRLIPYDSIITAYSAREAYGQNLLAVCLDPLDFGKEKYFAHLEVPEDDSLVLVTTLRILYVKRRTLQLHWQISFADLLFCRPNFDTVLLSVRDGQVRKRLVFCGDQGTQEWFCMKIDEGLAIFNEKQRSLD